MADETSLGNQDHDQRFKEAVRTFFAEFLELAVPSLAPQIDATRVRWVEQETLVDPPDGARHVMDLVAEVPMRTDDDVESWVQIVVLIEIDSRGSVTMLRTQIERYYHALRSRYPEYDVLPIAMLLRVGLNGLGWYPIERYLGERCIFKLQFAYVGLPALDAVEYVTGSNSFAVALSALMKVKAERRAWLKAQALKRVAEADETEQRQFILGEIVDAYLKLDEQENAEFEELLGKRQYERAKTMTTTWHQKGRAEGKAEGKAEMLLRLGTRRFGDPPREVRDALTAMSDPVELEILADRLLDAKDWQELLQQP